jgi:large subunit ribosomal protein L6
MSFLPKKYTIKIPKSIKVIYSESCRIIILVGPFGKRIIKLRTKIFLNCFKSRVYLSKFSFFKLSNSKIKNLINSRGILISVIKQNILEISILLYEKLKFIGVGYQASFVDLSKYKVLCLKIGYSHPIYLKLNKKIEFFCSRIITIFIFGNFYQIITSISAIIRSYKIPEVYKGKGILYDNEIVLLKKGKKT